MDESSQRPTTGGVARRRRVVPTRTADRPHGLGCCCTPQCTAEWRSKEPEDSHQGQGGGERDEVHGGGPEDPLPRSPARSTSSSTTTACLSSVGGGRIQSGIQGRRWWVRHSGVGYEVLLDVRVPQLGRDQVKEFGEVEYKAFEEEEKKRIRSKVLARIPLSSEERTAYLEFESRLLRRARALEPAAAAGSRSSNKMPGKSKRKKRRKKKLHKVSFSNSSRHVVDVNGMGMHDQDEFKGEEEVAEHDQRAGVLINLHAERLNSAHSKEVAEGMD